jgi:hypothetical protein
MNNYVIFQTKNQKKRLIPWMLYHKNQGFKNFIYFDDFSEDDSISTAEEASKKYNINLKIFKTDGIGTSYTYEQSQKPNDYGAQDFINRIIRSYNKGIEIVKSEEKESNPYLAFLDPDEFLVTSTEEKVSSVLENLNQNHYYVQSYDIKNNYEFDGFYPANEKTNYRWCDVDRLNTIFKHRGKSVIKLKSIEPNLSQSGDVVHNLAKSGYLIPDSNTLRIHHFRVPCLSDSIKWKEDLTLINISKELQKLYDL